MAQAECDPCGRVFTGVALFDKHQLLLERKTKKGEHYVICIDPAKLGMVQDKQGRWGTTDGSGIESRMAKARAARGQT